ncbi:MAG: acetate--CoA ligase family protein [Nanoarchaeota archaeon]|nr:acetate--CoA ligase family protein [Nanoarchaeota archaeon]
MKVMTEKEAEDFLESNNFRVAERVICSTSISAIKAARKLKYPVVMKIVSKKILHKSDAGGVALNIISDYGLKKEFLRMKKLKGFEAVMIQRYREGAYILLGLKKDAAFGHVVVVGAGGIYTEIFRDVSFRVCPITRQDAEEMLKEIKYYEVLNGARGIKYNTKPIIDALLKLSSLSVKHKNIEELDINPMILGKNNGTIVDARIVFS